MNQKEICPEKKSHDSTRSCIGHTCNTSDLLDFRKSVTLRRFTRLISNCVNISVLITDHLVL